MGLNEKFFKSADGDEPFFNTVLYPGSGDTTNGQSITGVGFEPDLVWIKSRNDSYNNVIYDSINGVNSAISSNLTDAAWANRNRFESFDLDGFTIEADNSGDLWKIDRENTNFVAWCWKAGGAAVSNTDGDVQSNVSANVANGFSIVKGTGSGSGVQTVGHGLNSAPELVIVKNLNTIDNSFVYSSPTGVSKYLQLNTTAQPFTWFQNMVVNSTEIGLRQESVGSWGNLIAYCFHSVAGVSKVGSYSGNGNNTGPVVNTGFEPSFVLIKATSRAGNWIMLDNKRNTSDPRDNPLYANTNGLENINQINRVNFDSTRFQVVGTGGDTNENGHTYIYYAIA